ncbi:MAG TPA: hypothetical protein VF486_21150 [Actinomycetes bacterium]
MNRSKRMGRLGGLAAATVAAAPFAYLWVLQMNGARDPLTAQARLDMAIWMAAFGTPWMLAAWLLWRAWWRQAGARLSSLDGPGWLLAAASATLPADRRDWGAAMAAELAQVQDRAARWRFAAGCARAAVFPPGGNRLAVGVTGALAVAAVAAAALATGAALPAGRVFALAFVGLLGGLATLAVARSRRVGHAGPNPAIAGLALAGVVACVVATTYYLAEYPSYRGLRPPGVGVSLPPVTAVVLAVVLAGCLWLGLRPPRWLLPDRAARRFGVGMAIALVAGFVLASRQQLRGAELDGGVMGYLLSGPILVVLTGSAAAAAVGRAFRAGLWACAWAVVLAMPLLLAAWLAEALRWSQQRGQLLLDGEGGLGLGANLGDAVWWTLVSLALWAVPLGVLGAAAGSWRARRRRARQPADLAPTS